MSRIYRINKGVNKPLEFKGLKAQYIGQLAIGLLLLLLLFTVMYLLGIHLYLCLVIIAIMGTALFMWLSHASRAYGRFGLMKKAARHRLPAAIRITSRNVFKNLNKKP